MKLFEERKNVGIVLIATNGYIDFIPDLIESINKYFLKDCNVNIYLFSDFGSTFRIYKNFKQTHIQHEVFPLISLRRYKTIYENKQLFNNEDYLYFIDADMKIVDYINESILGDLVGVLHPGYINTVGTPERDKKSNAFIDESENNMYFMGSFTGGKIDIYLEMCKQISECIEDDLNKGIIATWYDESHLNRYFLNNCPEIILSPSYAYPLEYGLNFKPKIVCINKDHKKYQV